MKFSRSRCIRMNRQENLLRRCSTFGPLQRVLLKTSRRKKLKDRHRPVRNEVLNSWTMSLNHTGLVYLQPRRWRWAAFHLFVSSLVSSFRKKRLDSQRPYITKSPIDVKLALKYFNPVKGNIKHEMSANSDDRVIIFYMCHVWYILRSFFSQHNTHLST